MLLSDPGTRNGNLLKVVDILFTELHAQLIMEAFKRSLNKILKTFLYFFLKVKNFVFNKNIKIKLETNLRIYAAETRMNLTIFNTF